MQLVMKSGNLYVKDNGDFLDKIKSLGRIPDAFLVTAHVMGLYPSILHDAGLKAALYEKLEERSEKKFHLQIWLTWQNLYSGTISLKLSQKSNYKFLVVP